MFILFVSLFAAIVFFKYLKVETIIVTQNSKSYNLNGLNSLYGKPILTLTEKSIKSTILNANPQLEDVLVEYEYPKTIKLKAVFSSNALYTKIEDRFAYINVDGYVTKITQDEPPNKNDAELTTYNIYKTSDFKIGQKVNSVEILFTLKFIDELLKNGITNYSVSIEDPRIIKIKIANVTTVIVAVNQNPNSSLQFTKILELHKRIGFTQTTYDLRFEKSFVSN